MGFLRNNKKSVFGVKNMAKCEITNESSKREMIECQMCRSLIFKDRAFKVHDSRGFSFPMGSLNYEYYCGKCKPPYDIIGYGENAGYSYWKIIPEKRVLCDEHGNEMNK